MVVKINKPLPTKHGTDYSQHLKSTEGHAQIGVQKKTKGVVTEETTDTQKVSTVLLPADHAVVTVGARQTVNLGDYNSASISVQLSLPCDKKEINEVYDFASDWVSERIQDTVKGIKE